MATILIVDDREICRDFLMTLLGYGPHHLLQASDGLEALNMINSEHPELIITDILMPTMNGYELVQKIKADPQLAKIPVIFYTASFLLDEAKLLADTCDVKHVLFKPSDPQLILDTVNGVLGITEPNLKAKKPPKSKPIDKHEKLSSKNRHFSNYFSEIEKTGEAFTAVIKETLRQSTKDEQLLNVHEQLSQTFKQLSNVSNQLVALCELNMNMISERRPKHILRLFCESARNIVGSKYCVLGILEKTKLKHFIVSGIDDKDFTGKADIAFLECGLIKRVLSANDILCVNNISEKDKAEFPSVHSVINHFLGARLITSNHLYGFVYFADKNDNAEFEEIDCLITNTLATEIAMLYENIDLYDTMQRHAAKLQISSKKADA